MKELGAELNLDSGTLSPLLKRLETTGDALREKATGIPDVIGTAMGLDDAGVARMRAELDRLTESVNAYREARSPA